MPPTRESIQARLQEAKETIEQEHQARLDEYRAVCVKGIGDMNEHFEDVLQAISYFSEDEEAILKASLLFDDLSGVLAQLVAKIGDDGEEEA